MKKPYIICHMMTSVDGRIDCAMTEHLPGVQEYYDTLGALNAPSRVSGRATAQLEMARPGVFESETQKRRSGKRPSPKPHPPRDTRSLRTRAARSSGTARMTGPGRCAS